MQGLIARWSAPPRTEVRRRVVSPVSAQQEGQAFMAFMGAVNGRRG